MLGDKQKQAVTNGSLAIQAGESVTINCGLSVSDVKELCLLFLRENFPKLKEEAIKEAEENVKVYIGRLETKLVNNAKNIDFKKFAKPDVQATLNDAVQANAKKGTKSNPEILASLVVERVKKGGGHFQDNVIEEAVLVAPKLTPEQISFLTLIHFITSMSVSGQASIGGVEPYALAIYHLLAPGLTISDGQKRHLEYTGALSFNHFRSIDIFEGWRKKLYAYLNIPDIAQFKTQVAQQAPAVDRLLKHYEKEKLGQAEITIVGKAIAIANISSVIENLDYSIWIK